MYLIIGGSGFLGRYLIKNILETTESKIVATYSTRQPIFEHPRLTWYKLDVRDIDNVKSLYNSLGDDVNIIYLAAYHHPDKVAKNPTLAWEHNIVALAQFVNVFFGAKSFYYASTDSVYGAGATAVKFAEDSPLAPVNLYGRHKVLAENITLTKDFNVVRFPFIFGPSLVETKAHFFDTLKAELIAGNPIEMFADSYRSTLSFEQCAAILIKLIELPTALSEKVLNISGDEILSKYDVGVRLAQKYNLDVSLVKPISVQQGNTIFTAKRADTAILDNTRLKKILNLNNLRFEI